MTEERDARREAVAIIDKILREPRIDPRDQLVKDLRTQLEILGLEDELERFSWGRDRRDLIEQFEYFKLKLKMRDYPEKHERKRARRAFDHEQFEEQVVDFRSPERKKLKKMDTEIGFLERKKRIKELKSGDSGGHWGIWVFVAACLLGAVWMMLSGDGSSPDFQRAGQVLTDGVWQFLQVVAAVSVCLWILIMVFKTVTAPKNKRD